MATYLRMSLRVPMQSNDLFSMARLPVCGRANPLLKTGVQISPQSEPSNDQIENGINVVSEPAQYLTKRYCGGALRFVNWFTSAQHVSVRTSRLLRTSRATGRWKRCALNVSGCARGSGQSLA